MKSEGGSGTDKQPEQKASIKQLERGLDREENFGDEEVEQAYSDDSGAVLSESGDETEEDSGASPGAKQETNCTVDNTTHKRKGRIDNNPSKSKKKNVEEISDSSPEIVAGLSGDEVDQSNIIQYKRRGSAQRVKAQIESYQQKAPDSDEDSW